MDDPISGSPGGKLVLLVDDDESLLDLIEHVVKKEGFRTERAANGADALRKARALSPDLLILDLMLPGVGGYEVLRQLQADGCGDIPIVVITGRALDPRGADLVRQESNVKEFMVKPVRPAAIVSALHRLLNTRPIQPRPETT